MDIEEVKKTARLARLELNENEIAEFASEFDRILDYFGQLKNAETDDEVPVCAAGRCENELREDIPNGSLKRASFLDTAPQAEDGGFILPRVVE